MPKINQPLFVTKAVSKATDQFMSVQTEQTITSLEVAELTGKQHKHIMRDIRNLLYQGVAETNFGPVSYKDAQNQERPMFLLTKKGCLILASGYDALLREKIIDRWEELEQQNQPQVPQTFSSALKLAYEQALLIEAQNAQIATLTPKADYCDKVLTSQSTFTTTQVAKGYGIPSAMKLNKMLKDHHIMFKQSGQWLPTSDYASKPYWEETTATISLGDDKVRTKKYYKWTELGIKWLREKFGFGRHFDYNLADA